MKQLIMSHVKYDSKGNRAEEWVRLGNKFIRMYNKTATYEAFRSSGDYGMYAERYNGNDTVYVWSDPEYKNVKNQFVGKKINGEYVEKYDDLGKLLFTIHKQGNVETEIKHEDDIVYKTVTTTKNDSVYVDLIIQDGSNDIVTDIIDIL